MDKYVGEHDCSLLKKSDQDPRERMIGFQMQPLVEALGITGGVCRLVIEVQVDKPVKVHFSRYLENNQCDKVVDYFKDLRSIEAFEDGTYRIQNIECESVTVDENGAVISIPKNKVSV